MLLTRNLIKKGTAQCRNVDIKCREIWSTDSKWQFHEFNFYGGKEYSIKGESDLLHRKVMVFYIDVAIIMTLPKRCSCSMFAYTLQVTVSKYISLFHALAL